MKTWPSRSIPANRRASLAVALIAIAMTATLASPARAAEGYELATPDPVLVDGIEFPHGVAVDQANHRVYVAVVSDNALTQAPGAIRRFESDGSAAGTFGVGPETFFSGVTVDPVTQGFYGSQVRAETPFGNFGVARLDPFSSTGAMGTPVPLSPNGTLPQIATDSSGHVFVPDDTLNSVRVFDPTGALVEEIGCGGCPGGAFGRPVSVALNSDDDLYVADLAPDRVVKFARSASSYGFESVLQSGRGATAVGVDPSSDDVFVGDFPNGHRYHVVAYDSSGVQFDDFGVGLFADPPLGAIAAAQIAADATTHRLYLTETDKVYVFERVTIDPPSAASQPASAISDVAATLNATVNANGHAVLECEFEFTDDGDFQANGFANATTVPCSKLADGFDATATSAAISGLTPVTTYHFRVTATNNAGSKISLAKTFETLPPEPEPEPEPDPEPSPAPAPSTDVPPPAAPPTTDPTPEQRLPKCRKGFRRRNVGGQPRCVKVCRRGFRNVRVKGKTRCVKKRRSRGVRRRGSQPLAPGRGGSRA